MDHCDKILLVILNTPQRDDKDCLAQVIQRRMARLHLQIRREGGHSPTQNPEHEIHPQDIVNMVRSSIPCEIKSLMIEDRRASDGAAPGVGMAITRLSDPGSDDPILTQQSLSRLTIMHFPQEENEGRLMNIIRECPSLKYLQVGCNGERSFSLVDRVVSTRNAILQERGSCSLHKFELTEKNLGPFDVLAYRDSDFHIQTHILFPADRAPFNMRTWIRFRGVVDIEDNHPVHSFIWRYGWSFVFIDECTIDENTSQAIVENNTTAMRSQLETLIASNHSATIKVSLLDKVIKRSPNFQDLELCIQFGNFRDITPARLLISQYGTVLARLQLSGGAPSQCSRITSCFAKRSSFPSLQSFERTAA
ncbi:MAG: hypothetical protein J3Q66DRAFT_147008 [Benniella sp.]|nr:MAG: hypothetical protein J3Q66DRAFT_147008 [Benniella sp.]